MTTIRPTPTRWAIEVAAAGQGDRAEATTADERRWIEQAQRGDHEAFARLLQRHQRRVFSLIAHLVRSPAEVEDIAQEVFLKVYRSLGRFDFRAAFSTWLYRVVVNECYDHLRRQRAQKSSAASEVQVGELEELDRLAVGQVGPAPADAARRAELRQLVERLFRRLPADDRLLLALRELEGFSMEEIAGLLKVKENTVKVRLFRARKRLVEIHRRLSGRSGLERGGP
ncbi:MAG: sigma-70 family RNA polymerase sigma factor [Acidobacteria bacterium]|nr:sigma-70 family RNA polymerase sigma factor [Acidobacteriota bacterium]